MKKQEIHKKTAIIITAILCLILAASLIAIFHPVSSDSGYVADIYQNGELLTSVLLEDPDAPLRFTITGENGCINEIEVRSHSIGIVSASCPDKLCVHQGFIDTPDLPIVCLPNKLVIQLRQADSEAVDMIAY